METLNERLTKAFNILIDKAVFFEKYNPNYFCGGSDPHLTLVTNYLSMRDIKVISVVCELYSLKFGISTYPSISDNNLQVTIKGL